MRNVRFESSTPLLAFVAELKLWQHRLVVGGAQMNWLNTAEANERGHVPTLTEPKGMGLP